MKFLAFILFAVCLQASARGFSQSVTLKLKNTPLEKAFREVRKVTGYTFVYSKEQLKDARDISINVRDAPLEHVLDVLFSGQPVTYVVSGNYIVVKQRKTVAEPVTAVPVMQITGHVTNERSEPLEGVTVQAKASKEVTTTNAQGDFLLTVPDNVKTVIFSFVGMRTEEVLVRAGVMQVMMKTLDSILSDVLITGYTSQSRRSITGSVVNVKSEEIKDVPVTNINQALQGKAAGVTVLTDGSPSGNVSVMIRGIGTLNGSDPLYVIDGIPTTGSLNQVNPADIASISILKDASSASIYGSRAANGVVIIETRKGKSGQKPSLDLDAYAGVATISKKPKLLNSQQFANTYFQSMKAGGIANPSDPQLGSGPTPVIPDFLSPVSGSVGDPNTTIDTYDLINNQIIPANKQGTNWFDEITRPALLQSYNVGVTGGGQGSRYAFSAGYLDRQGTVIYSSFDRYTVRINSEFSLLNNKARVGENINISYFQNRGKDGIGALVNSYVLTPLLPVRDIAGNFAGTRGGTLALGGNFDNPVAMQTRGQYDLNRNINLLGNLYLEYDIVSGLQFKTNFGAEYSSLYGSAFAPLSPENALNGLTNDLTESTNWLTSRTWTNSLKFSRRIAGDHHINALVGTEAIILKGQGYSATRRNLFSADPSFRYLVASGGAQSNIGNMPTDNTLFSLFGNIDYSFKDRYIVNATLRRDGSSRFRGSNQYGIFPALGVGWILSDESFWKPNTVVNSVKLRAAYGQTGNQNSASQFGFADLYGADPATSSYDINATQTTVAEGLARILRGNPNLKWESTATWNFGIDASILKNKINLSIEWYKRETRNMLASGSLPGTAGALGPPIINIGKVNNTGIDMSANYSDHFGAFSVNIGANVFGYRNEVVSIDGNPNTFLLGGGGGQQDFATRTQAGHPISSFYGLIVDGVIQDGSDAGNFQFRDLNKDNIIDDKDKTYIGSPHPDFQYSLTLNLAYKNWGLEIFFRGSQGNKLWNWTKYLMDFANDVENRSVSVLNAWTPDNKSNSLAQFNFATAGRNSRASSYYLEDGSFLRIQNIQLNYSFRHPLLKSCKAFLQVQNLATFTKYSGISPDVISSNLSLGVDNVVNYPVPRTIMAGINLGF